LPVAPRSPGLGADRSLDLLREILELGAPGHLARELVARDLCLGPRADEPAAVEDHEPSADAGDRRPRALVDYAHFPAGHEVFHQGDRGDRFYVIEDGEADVIGDGRLIRTMGPGDGFGEIALLRDTPRTTTVRARTSLRLYALDRLNFVSAVGGYRSSVEEADALMLDELGTFDPRGGSTG
jgi:hypothetical protein